MYTQLCTHTRTVSSLDRFKMLTSTSHWIRILIEKEKTRLNSGSTKQPVPPVGSFLCWCTVGYSACLPDWHLFKILKADNKLVSVWIVYSVMVGLSDADGNSSMPQHWIWKNLYHPPLTFNDVWVMYASARSVKRTCSGKCWFLYLIFVLTIFSLWCL